jgi:hypothetical protein
MTSEEDNFDIDIYGDGEGNAEGNEDDYKGDDSYIDLGDSNQTEQETPATITAESGSGADSHANNGDTQLEDIDPSVRSQLTTPTPRQGTKRKESSDERPTDPGATSAIMISDLHWWTTEDDVRGWTSQAGCEGELKDVTFSEHKVNGKSKGYEHFVHAEYF